MLRDWELPLEFLGLGALFLGFAWLLLAEYRRLFLANPLSVMSFEVLARIVGAGGPGYIAAILLFAGGIMFSVGVLITVVTVATYILHFVHRAFPAA